MPPLKIATWNVNGIRARESQVLEWVERERPDVVCLQELKSTVAQVPPSLCELQGYRCYWHGERAYSGVGLHIRRDAFLDEPRFLHPTFDYETRIVTAQMSDLSFVSVYVPNGGKDFPAKMKFLGEMERYVAEIHASGGRVVLCGDINITRTERDVHPKSAIRRSWGSGRRKGRCSSAYCRKVLWMLGVRSTPIMKIFSPGGRLGVTCVSAISAGGWITFWRLNLWLRRPAQCAVYREIGTSDHAPVVAVFDLNGEAVGAGAKAE